jgi:hypothetical protein
MRLVPCAITSSGLTAAGSGSLHHPERAGGDGARCTTQATVLGGEDSRDKVETKFVTEKSDARKQKPRVRGRLERRRPESNRCIQPTVL